MFRRCSSRNARHALRDARLHAGPDDATGLAQRESSSGLAARHDAGRVDHRHGHPDDAVGTLTVLAQAVQQNSDYGDGHGEAAQHARVTLGRIAARSTRPRPMRRSPACWSSRPNWARGNSPTLWSSGTRRGPPATRRVCPGRRRGCRCSRSW